MKFFSSFLFLILLSTFSYSQEDNIRPGELLVQFRPEIDESAYTNAFMQYDVKKVQLLSEDMNIWLITYDTDRVSDKDMLVMTKNHYTVKEAQFNHVIQLRGSENLIGETLDALNNLSNFPNDPRFNEQWALHNTGQTGGLPDADIDAPEAWDFTTGGLTSLGDTIVVAIVDGGCDLNHNDLNYWINWAEIPGNGIDDDGNGYIDDYRGWNAYNNNGNVPSNSHGTHVSGIAGAKGNNDLGVSGVNWNVKIMPVAGSSSSEATVVAAYGYVLKMRKLYNQTNGVQGAFIVSTNASFGVDYGNPNNYPLWCGIYDSLGVQGVLSCGATANLNINIDVAGDVPTACPSPWMIAVTNTTHNDVKNSGAAYGATTIDLGAPGTNVLSTYPGNSYSSLTGTSMATPQVTGAIALMFAAANSGIMESYKSNPSQGAIVFRDFLFDGTDPIASLQGITVTGGRLNVFNAILPLLSPPDTVPPTTVTDLSIIDPTSGSLTLQWTAPLDTSLNGVVGYDIRMSPSPILNENDFNNAQQLAFSGSPAIPGSTENLLVESLDFSTTYYFALRSRDLWNNLSEISNSPNGTTFGAPLASVNPASVHIVLSNNTIETETVTLSNVSSGNSTLDYSVTLENNTFPEGIFDWRAIPVGTATEQAGKDNLEVSFGQSIFGSGGPDEFGYEWIDSNEPNGPDYVWEDIVGNPNSVQIVSWTGNLDDGYTGAIPVGFGFDFYGNTYTNVYVSTNGFLSLSPLTTSYYTNSTTMPNSSAPNNIICPFWDDLEGRTQGTVHYLQDGNRFILQYTNWQRYSSSGGVGSLTFQVILHSSGKILFYYNNMVGTLNSATIGIENQNGIVGLPVAINSTYVQNSLAVQISAEPDWLGVDPISGRLYNGNSVDIELTFRTEDFPLGDYSMDMKVSSNDPLNPTITVPVTLQIVPIPVELSSFSAEARNNNVVLNWTTASEINNSGFAVERKDGKWKMENGKWESVGFVEGKGSTTEVQSYSYSDGELNVGKYIYRLKQIDYDGSYEYSPEVEIEVLPPQEYSLKQNYPNPFNPVTTIEYTLPENAEVSIEIYNALGELVSLLVNGVIEAGYQKLTFDASSLTSGTYIYRINAKGQSKNYIESKKMMLVK
jgi:hypothetical protein